MWSHICRLRWQTPVFTSSKNILLGLLRLRKEQQHLRMLMLTCTGELLEQRDQLQANQAHLMEGGLHLQGQYTEHVQQLRRELQEAQHQRVLDSESGTASRQIIQREKAIHQRNLAEQAERWRVHSMEILMRAELQCQIKGKRFWLRETL